MRFQITDNLPDLSDRVYKEEVRLLLPIAGSLLRKLTGSARRDIVADAKEVWPHEDRAVREGIDHQTG
jgi:hypothetical protein